MQLPRTGSVTLGPVCPYGDDTYAKAYFLLGHADQRHFYLAFTRPSYMGSATVTDASLSLYKTWDGGAHGHTAQTSEYLFVGVSPGTVASLVSDCSVFQHSNQVHQAILPAVSASQTIGAGIDQWHTMDVTSLISSLNSHSAYDGSATIEFAVHSNDAGSLSAFGSEADWAILTVQLQYN